MKHLNLSTKAILFACTTISSFLFGSCSDMFQEKVKMDTGSKIATLADLINDKKNIDNLTPPSQVFVSQGDSASSITVSWTSVQDSQSYRLERAVVKEKNADGQFEEPAEGDFQVINGDFGNTAYLYGTTFYIDTILSSPSFSNPEYNYKYFYRICAENPSKGYGASEFTIPQGGTLFAPPTNVTASAGSYKDKVLISWNKSISSSTTGYRIYRSQNSDGTNSTELATVKANMTSFTDFINESNRGTEFYYTVCAENSTGNSSSKSSTAMGYARTDGAPEQVKDVHVTDGRGFSQDSITISWTGDSDTYYSVYRSSSKDSALTMLTSSLTGSSSYTYTDSNNLSENLFYYYMVQPWKYADDNTTQVKGQMSDTSSNSATPAEGFLLSPPQSVYVTKSYGQHTIAWTKAIGLPEEQESYSYVILGSHVKETGFTEIATVAAKSMILFEGEYSFNIDNPYPYYKIQTKNSEGNLSSQSSTVAPAPYAPKNVSVSRYANLYSEMGTDWNCNINEVYPVKITWSAPDEASDVAGYYIYRSDKKDKGFKQLSIGNDEKSFLINSTTFYDLNESARPKKIYYYKIVSVNTLGNGTNYSDTEYGYGALTANQYMREYNTTVMNSQKKLTLMHKNGNTDKLGTEYAKGSISGELYYNAGISGVSGRVIMKYTNYSDYYIHSTGKIDSSALTGEDEVIGTAGGTYFTNNGNTNTSAGIDTNGTMDGTVTCKGMYPGSVCYDKIEIKSGAAGGGYYIIKRDNFEPEKVNWTVGNE